MQLRIEYNPFGATLRQCMLCHQMFELKEASVILCNSKNHEYGNVCPGCIRRGSQWMQVKLLELQIFHTVQKDSRKLA